MRSSLPNPLTPLLVLGMVAAMAAGSTQAFPRDESGKVLRPGPSAPAPAPDAHQPAEPRVDLNRASKAQLKTLPGIGDAEAAKIVAHRPYKAKTDLVEKNVLSVEAYGRLSTRVVVDHRKPAAKPKS